MQVALLYFAIAWTTMEFLPFLFDAIPAFPAETNMIRIYELTNNAGKRLESLGDELPACVANMPANNR